MFLAEMSWPEVSEFDRSTPVVIPVAAVEQHGHHLPVYTDSFLLGEIVRRAASQLTQRVLFAPLNWLGNSEHHLDFPGTMSAAPRTYLDVLRETVGNFLVHGFQRLVLLNGHGGNIVPAQQALFEVRQAHRGEEGMLLLSATYWTLGTTPQQADPSIQQTAMGHAGELETSMMLCLRPDLVADYQRAEPVPTDGSFAPAHRAWITKERSAPGHIGFPHLANAEKGERLFQAFTNDVVSFLDRVCSWDGSSWEG